MASLLRKALLLLCTGAVSLGVRAEPPGVSYIFPAGGQRGVKVPVRVGGFYFHGQAEFKIEGSGVTATPIVKETETIWFEGPPVHEPASQKPENYPKDHLGEVNISGEAALGVCRWHCRTSQGTIPSMKFVIGDLPEIVEKEMDGAPIPQTVTLPLTINGRIFPREDEDIWRFHAEKGQIIVCELESRSLGYPLQATVDVTGPGGVSVRNVHKQNGREGDPSLSFTALVSGEHQIAIHDAGFSGGQNFVYRLTLTSGPRIESIFPLGGRRGETVQVKCSGPGMDEKMVPVKIQASGNSDYFTQPVQIDGHPAGNITLHVDDLPEFNESTPVFTLPAVLNGRIDRAGKVDAWSFDLEKDQTVLLDILAAHLGSRLDSVLTLHDADDKEVARNDDRVEGRPDARLLFTAAKAGRYTAKVADRFASRGSRDFGYRMRVTPQPAANFELTLLADASNVTRQTDDEAKPVDPAAAKTKAPKAPKVPGLRVDFNALGNFTKDITIEVTGLPDGVTAAPLVLSAKKKFGDINISAPPKTPLQTASISIRGTTEVDGKQVTRLATVPVPFGEAPSNEVRLGIVPAVPFKFVGHYVFVNDQGGGTTGSKHYKIERDGFDGPLTVRFSDKQIRYLRAVSGAPLIIPAGATEFDYTINYPVDIEQGHTSRTQIMVVGEITDFDGSRHLVSYTSNTNDEQLVCSTTAGPLRLSTEGKSYPAIAGGRITVPVTVQFAHSLKPASVQISLLLPKHMTGISAKPVIIEAGQGTRTLEIEFGPNPGPFNMPVTIVGRMRDATGAPILGETKIELVPSSRTASR